MMRPSLETATAIDGTILPATRLRISRAIRSKRASARAGTSVTTRFSRTKPRTAVRPTEFPDRLYLTLETCGVKFAPHPAPKDHADGVCETDWSGDCSRGDIFFLSIRSSRYAVNEAMELATAAAVSSLDNHAARASQGRRATTRPRPGLASLNDR